jgi:hypothetical protein
MRADELQGLREQRKHYVAEFRSMNKRLEATGQDLCSKADRDRLDYIGSEVDRIDNILQEGHNRELEEIRSAGGGNGRGTREVAVAGYERSFAREPLYEAFRSAGFARGKPAEIPWQEFRSITWTGSVDNLNQPRRAAEYLGFDQHMPTRRFRLWASTRASRAFRF